MAKLGIMLGSLVAALAGYAILRTITATSAGARASDGEVSR